MPSTSNSKQKRIVKRQQASKPKTPIKKARLTLAPEDLAELISLVNLVPAANELPEFDGPDSGSANALKSLDQVPAELREHLGQIYRDSEPVPIWEGKGEVRLALFDVWRRYTDIRNAREGFNLLAERGASIVEIVDDLGYYWTPLQATSTVRIHKVVSSGKGKKVTYEAENKLSDWFARAIQGVDILRIRKCAVCGKIFFAGRLPAAAGCSPKCNKALRNQRWLNKYRDGYYQGAAPDNRKKEAGRKSAQTLERP